MDDPALALLAEIVDDARWKAHHQVRETLASERYGDIAFGLACWVACRGWRQGADIDVLLAQRRNVRDFAAEILTKRHRQVRKRGRNFAGLDPVARHDLRILFKKLRYGTEFFASLFPGREFDRYRAATSRMQDLLGHMNDVTVAQHVVDDLLSATEPGATAAVGGPGCRPGARLVCARRPRARAARDRGLGGVPRRRPVLADPGQVRLDREAETSMLRVLVTNIKGGCGKTTIATNLAAAFSAGGFATGLAEVDRQRSSLTWLKLRDGHSRPIASLDWRKEVGEVPSELRRLVIDAPANLRMRHVDELIAEADLVVVPVLASVFDEGSTERFLAKLDELKPIRKGRKTVALVANRLRPRSKAAQRLDGFLERLGQPIAARLSDRAVYGELAVQGLSIFDIDGHLVRPVREEWRPLLNTIEEIA